jgi:hypothetical protein
VKHVWVDGKLLKEDFRLKSDLARPRELVMESRDYLLSQVPAQQGWLVSRTQEPAPATA